MFVNTYRQEKDASSNARMTSGGGLCTGRASVQPGTALVKSDANPARMRVAIDP